MIISRPSYKLYPARMPPSSEPVPSPLTITPDCPPELAAVVMKALAKERDQRFDTMSDLARELELVAAKLVMPEPARDPESFIRDVLKARAEERATTIKQALRAADERPASLTQSGITPFPRDRISQLEHELGALYLATATPGQRASMLAVIQTANAALAASTNSIAGVTILDAYGIIDAMSSNPAAYGLSNVTDPCYGGTCDTNTNLYWDGIHLTSRAYGLIADAAYDALTPAERDRTAWRIAIDKSRR